MEFIDVIQAKIPIDFESIRLYFNLFFFLFRTHFLLLSRSFYLCLSSSRSLFIYVSLRLPISWFCRTNNWNRLIEFCLDRHDRNRIKANDRHIICNVLSNTGNIELCEFCWCCLGCFCMDRDNRGEFENLMNSTDFHSSEPRAKQTFARVHWVNLITKWQKGKWLQRKFTKIYIKHVVAFRKDVPKLIALCYCNLDGGPQRSSECDGIILSSFNTLISII